jgi:ubiquinone biosynthesis protein COQ9
MPEQNTTRDKIVAAALRLAAAKGWRDLGLDEIAGEAEISLRALRKEFCAKPQILAAFIRFIDDEVLERIKPAAPEDTPHDRLFDVIMTRFEALQPYRAGVKRIVEDLRYEPGAAIFQVLPTLSSQYWMLTAAGVNVEGLMGALRLPGAAAIYAAAFRVWLDDEDPGLAKTMAALDKRLRRGERLMRRCEDICEASRKLFRALLPGGCQTESRAGRRGEGADSPTTESGSGPAVPAPTA